MHREASVARMKCNGIRDTLGYATAPRIPPGFIRATSTLMTGALHHHGHSPHHHPNIEHHAADRLAALAAGGAGGLHPHLHVSAGDIRETSSRAARAVPQGLPVDGARSAPVLSGLLEGRPPVRRDAIAGCG